MLSPFAHPQNPSFTHEPTGRIGVRSSRPPTLTTTSAPGSSTPSKVYVMFVSEGSSASFTSVPAPCPHDRQKASREGHSYEKKTARMRAIHKRLSERIGKYLGGLFESDAVFSKVHRGLLVVPLELAIGDRRHRRRSYHPVRPRSQGATPELTASAGRNRGRAETARRMAAPEEKVAALTYGL